MGPLRTRVVPVAASLGAGLLLGLVGPVADKMDNHFCVAVGAVFSGGWSWACYAFMVGCSRRSKIESALLSSLGLALGVVAYYIFKDLSPAIPQGAEPVSASSGIQPDVAGQGISPQIIVWGTAAFVLGAPVGILGNLARIPGVGGLGFRLIVPLVAFYETSVRLSVEADGQNPVVGTTWSIIRFAAGAVALTLVSHTIWRWWHARRTYARSGGGDRIWDTSPEVSEQVCSEAAERRSEGKPASPNRPGVGARHESQRFH